MQQGTNTANCNKNRLSLGDYVVTEAGLGADFGKFLHIKCEQSGLKPDAVVFKTIVIKHHAGLARKILKRKT